MVVFFDKFIGARGFLIALNNCEIRKNYGINDHNAIIVTFNSVFRSNKNNYETQKIKAVTI